MSSKPGVSVIVCCYNSALRIETTLKHLAEQIVPDTIAWEIIVVNNNSSDNTVLKATVVWASYNKAVRFTIVEQTIKGLSNARQKGIEISQFDYLLFCDDDNWLEEKYVYNAYTIMHENTNIGILAGQSIGRFEVEKPFWFSTVEAAYAVGKPLAVNGLANNRHYLAGAGFIVRRSLFNDLAHCSFKHILTGRTGNKLSSGDDTELCLLAQFLGYDLYFHDSLVFTHYIPAHRLTWKYCVEMCKGHARPLVYFNLYNHSFKRVMANKEIRFREAFNNFWIKHSKSLFKDFFGLKLFFKTMESLLFSKPGSLKELAIKKKVARLLYAVQNKKEIRDNFYSINELMYKIKAKKRLHKSSSVFTDFLK